jgi:DNA (cytosine-5)-methyltransferase 1
MTEKPRLLDLYCRAGGASMGYYEAGFEVVGVDIEPQPYYPFEFHLADALTYPLDGFDAYHASPPCQAWTLAGVIHRNNGKIYPELIIPTRLRLIRTGKPFIIENVPPARKVMINPFMLCGTMFNLGVFRHRYFETSFKVIPPEHTKHPGKIGDGKYFSVAGGAGRWKSWGTVYRNTSKGTIAQWREAMGIDWMIRKDIKEAIPKAYTYFIGEIALEVVMENRKSDFTEVEFESLLDKASQPLKQPQKPDSKEAGTSECRTSGDCSENHTHSDNPEGI